LLTALSAAPTLLQHDNTHDGSPPNAMASTLIIYASSQKPGDIHEKLQRRPAAHHYPFSEPPNTVEINKKQTIIN